MTHDAPTDDDAELAEIRKRKIAGMEGAHREAQRAEAAGAGGHPTQPGLTLWCPKHFEPYKQDRTLNGLLAGKLLTDALLSDEPFQTMCGRDDAKGKQADGNRIPVEGARLGPVCCYLGEERRTLALNLTREARHRAAERAGATIAQRDLARGHPTVRGGGGA